MMMTLPIMLPLFTAAICVLLWNMPRIQLALGILCNFAVLAAGVYLLLSVREHGIQSASLGGWAAPFGIVLVADLLGCIMVILGAIVGSAVAVSSIAGIDSRRLANGYVPLMLALLASVSGAFLSGDIFNLYVWFELMLLSSFVLLTLGGERAQLEGAIKYVTLNLLSSVLFLASIGLIYATTGTLNMAQLALALDAFDNPALATLLCAPMLVAFGIKAAVFPAYFWLPASYHTPPPLVSALFAGLLTKVGVYSLIRVLTLIYDQERALLADAVLLIAGLTMVSGVLGAVAQKDMRRILSFHIVSQIGYMLMGLGIALATVAAVDEGRADAAALDGAAIAMAGAVFYIAHHIIVKTNLFLCSGAVMRGRGTSALSGLGGVVRTHPVLAALFLISALSLAGIPVFSGFWAKLALVRGGLQVESYAIVIVSLAVSLLTLLSMMKIWTEGFWGERKDIDADDGSEPDAPAPPPTPLSMIAPIATLAALSITIGLAAGPVWDVATETARQLLDSDTYITAVLGEHAAPPGGMIDKVTLADPHTAASAVAVPNTGVPATAGEVAP